jgi:hypothetical protein
MTAIRTTNPTLLAGGGRVGMVKTGLLFTRLVSEDVDLKRVND